MVINYQRSLVRCVSNLSGKDCEMYTLMLLPQISYKSFTGLFKKHRPDSRTSLIFILQPMPISFPQPFELRSAEKIMAVIGGFL